jgi:hypothetical protein
VEAVGCRTEVRRLDLSDASAGAAVVDGGLLLMAAAANRRLS